MTPHAQALGLLDAVTGAGATLLIDAQGLELIGELPEPLSAALSAFVGEGEHRAARPSYRALAAVLRAPSRAAREILGMPVAHAKIPGIAYAVTIDRKGCSSVFTTSRAIFDRESGGQRPVWRYPELDAMARAHDQGRVGPLEFDHWLTVKARGGQWTLTPQLAGCLGDAPAPHCTMGELFDSVGASVVDVELEGER